MTSYEMNCFGKGVRFGEFAAVFQGTVAPPLLGSWIRRGPRALTNEASNRHLYMQYISPSKCGAHKAGTVRLAVIGDVHGQWHAADVVALHQLGADCVLFVGDFGEEDLKLVTGIANIDHPKAVILGNHDAWCPPDTVPVTRTVCPAPQRLTQGSN